jgi:hypothetical protein
MSSAQEIMLILRMSVSSDRFPATERPGIAVRPLVHIHLRRRNQMTMTTAAKIHTPQNSG